MFRATIFLMLLASVLPQGRAATLLITDPPFNAACDGITNDVLPVQAAINALNDGDTLLIPGLAAIGAPGLSISGKNEVVVMGTAPGAGFRAIASTYPSGLTLGPTLVRIANCSGLQVRHLLLDGDGRDLSLICFGACTGCRMAHCEVRDLLAPPEPGPFNAVAGITSLGCSGLVLEHNHIHDLLTLGSDGPRGIWAGAVDTNWFDTDGIIRHNTIERTAGTGIAIHSARVRADSNAVLMSGGAGIKVNTTQPGNEGEVLLRGNTLIGHAFHGIQLNSFGPTITLHNVLIEGNLIDSVRNSGIHIFDRARDIVIRGNTFGRHSLNNCVNGYNWGEGGVYCAASVRGLVIEGNVFDAEGGPACGQGVGIESHWYNPWPLRDIRICGNTFTDQLYNGVRLRATPGSQAMDSVLIADNTFNGMGNAGIEVINTGQVIGTVWSCGNSFTGTAPEFAFTNYSAGQMETCQGCTFDLSTGVRDTNSTHLAAPWPNPADQLIWLPSPGPFVLVDAQSRVVLSADGNIGTVDVGLLAPGMYLLRHGGASHRLMIAR